MFRREALRVIITSLTLGWPCNTDLASSRATRQAVQVLSERQTAGEGGMEGERVCGGVVRVPWKEDRKESGSLCSDKCTW